MPSGLAAVIPVAPSRFSLHGKNRKAALVVVDADLCSTTGQAYKHATILYDDWQVKRVESGRPLKEYRVDYYISKSDKIVLFAGCL